jgi:hypothetical protein
MAFVVMTFVLMTVCPHDFVLITVVSFGFCSNSFCSKEFCSYDFVLIAVVPFGFFS